MFTNLTIGPSLTAIFAKTVKIVRHNLLLLDPVVNSKLVRIAQVYRRNAPLNAIQTAAQVNQILFGNLFPTKFSIEKAQINRKASWVFVFIKY